MANDSTRNTSVQRIASLAGIHERPIRGPSAGPESGISIHSELWVGLGLLWLVLLIVEFIWGLAPWLEQASTVIWIVFLLDFSVRFALAPKKRVFLTRNWMTIISLALPAFRVLRFARVLRLARATRGLKLVRLLTSTNRGIRSLGVALGARGAGYVAALTLVVIAVGAAGMLVFEGTATRAAFSGYAEALWWTAMSDFQRGNHCGARARSAQAARGNGYIIRHEEAVSTAAATAVKWIEKTYR